ncbi:alpha/beta fold hydrolase [Streptantibioticus silvisoli]|uniref:Alpha/beta fold hydrolase n=1 Tax=Streptantibioticus silvisoli TaxID=2705255 RepID=A0ABT6W3N4_9ACTN|nr:alpha/beta fold hydrolase [Streptantibioticus silvisoli]MDI5964293.1 alpha/beta fold hydrolase [Streptantibioticus silvisoli]
MTSPGAGRPVTRHQAEVRGTRLSWTEQGSGPLAVFAHGLTGSGHAMEDAGMLDWSPVVRAGRRLVRYDARGHGRSAGEALPEVYAWPRLADDLIALTDRLSGGGPVAGIGCSMGTATLLYAALKAPDRFERLVLTAPPTGWATRAEQAHLYREAADFAERVGPESFQRLAALRPVPAVFAGLSGYPPAPQVSPALLATVLRGAAATDLPAVDLLRALDLPVLVLAWADDPGHPVSTAETLAATLPDARLEVASTPADLRTWGDRAAAFLTEGDR